MRAVLIGCLICCPVPIYAAPAGCTDLVSVRAGFGKSLGRGGNWDNANEVPPSINIRKLATMARQLPAATQCKALERAHGTTVLPSVRRQVAAALGGTAISAIGSTPSAVIGQTIIVSIQIRAVADLYAFQFDLSSAVSVNEGPFLQGGGITYFVPGTIDNVGGSITANADTLIGPISGVTGNGSVATITFTAKASGTSPLSLANVILLSSSLSDITATAQNGSVSIVTTSPSIPATPAPSSLLLVMTGGLTLIGYPDEAHQDQADKGCIKPPEVSRWANGAYTQSPLPVGLLSVSRRTGSAPCNRIPRGRTRVQLLHPARRIRRVVHGHAETTLPRRRYS